MPKITKSSGNVFADVGAPEADSHLVKAELVRRIGIGIAAAKLKQAEAAERFGMTQPDVSKMLRGQFRPISLEKLMHCLVALGSAVTIDVQMAPKSSTPTIRVAPEKSKRRELA